MDKPNIPNPKDSNFGADELRNRAGDLTDGLRNREGSAGVDGVREKVTSHADQLRDGAQEHLTGAKERVTKVTDRTPAERTAGSTAVEGNTGGGGWWKWLLGLIVLALLAWLLWSLLGGSGSGETAATVTSTVATTTVQAPATN